MVGSDGMRVEYGDDTMLYLSKGVGRFKNVITVLQIFEATCGLKINLSKCSLAGVNVGRFHFEVLICFFLGCSVMQLSFSYLRLPLGGHHRGVRFWDPVIAKACKCLDG